MSAESVCSAACRLLILMPSDCGKIADNSLEKCPFKKTRRLAFKSAKEDLAMADLSKPLRLYSNTGLKGSRAIGATLVKRQSSSWMVGKPSSAKRAMAALRMGNTHEGCFNSRFAASNFSQYGSVFFPAPF